MLFIYEKLIQYQYHPPLYKIYNFVHLILCGGKNDRNCNYLPNLTITMINIFFWPFCLFIDNDKVYYQIPISYSDLVNTANEQNLLVNPKVTPRAPN